MKLDYLALEESLESLDKNFGLLVNSLGSIVSANKLVTSEDNWSGKVRDEYLELFNDIIENFVRLNEKYDNTTKFIYSVIENYNRTESAITTTFKMKNETR